MKLIVRDEVRRAEELPVESYQVEFKWMHGDGTFYTTTKSVEFYTKDKVSMEVFEEFLNDCKGLSTLNSSSELKEDLRFKKWFDSDSYYFGHYRLNDKYDNWLYNDFDYDKTFDDQCPAKLKNFQVFYYDYLSTKYDVDVDFEK